MALSSPLPRWKRRSAARPEEILEAALSVFTEKGFDAARMEDVAREAGLSKAGIYLYFPGKTALLEALIQAKVAPLAHNAEAIAKAGAADPMTALRAVLAVAVERLRDPKAFAVPRLVIGVSSRFPEIADYYREHTVDRARAAIEGLIEAAMARGAIRRVDVGAVVRALIGPIFFEAMWTHVLRGQSALNDPSALLASHVDVLLNGLENRA
jgi:AcrR family transcriptional regulator